MNSMNGAMAGVSGMSAMPGMTSAGDTSGMLALPMHMLQDPIIRRRLMHNPAMRGMMLASLATAPEPQRVMLADMLRSDSLAARPATRRRRSEPRGVQPVTHAPMQRMNAAAGAMKPMQEMRPMPPQ